MEKLTGVDFLREYAANEEKYLPMIGEWKKWTDENPVGYGEMGWNAGVIAGTNRPYYCVCWYSMHITTLSVYMTTKGMENATDEELDRLMQENGVYKRKPEYNSPAQVDRFGEGDDEFFLITQTVGDEEETYLTDDGAKVFPYEALYEFNRERNNGKESK